MGVDVVKLVLKFTWKSTWTGLTKAILKKNKVSGLYNFKTYYRAVLRQCGIGERIET